MVQQAHWNVVILGAGAAGLMAAATAGARGLSVLVLERLKGRWRYLGAGVNFPMSGCLLPSVSTPAHQALSARTSIWESIMLPITRPSALFCDHSSRRLSASSECGHRVVIRCNVDDLGVGHRPFESNRRRTWSVFDRGDGLSLWCHPFAIALRWFGLRMTECRPAWCR